MTAKTWLLAAALAMTLINTAVGLAWLGWVTYRQHVDRDGIETLAWYVELHHPTDGSHPELMQGGSGCVSYH